jgi:DNA adenine methylase
MPVVAEAAVTPPLKWAGGKRWQVPHLRPLWEPHTRKRLVEPFCGGLAVAIGLAPERALLNDANPHLINFYRWLQRGLDRSISMKNDEGSFYRHRNRFNERLASGAGDTAEAAELFYYLNRTGYNGLCRFNRDGEFNVPFGRYKKIGYAEDFSAYRLAFEGWTFMVGDVENVPVEPGDFVYADPPYDVEFTHYSTGGFTWEDQQRTAACLARHRGPVVLVNQATKRMERLYKSLGYAVQYLVAPRRISCTGDRTPAREIMGTRNL